MSHFGTPAEVIVVSRVAVDATSRTLEQLGVEVDGHIAHLTLTNLGDADIYFEYDDDPDVNAPTVGSPTSPLIPAANADIDFHKIHLALAEHGALRLRFRCADQSTSEMLVQQEGPQEIWYD